MKLQSLPKITSRKSKRVGRGYGSGLGGHTSGRGQKGQKSRSSVPLWFEGGQLPLIKRLPMWRGKGRLKSQKEVVSLTLDLLNQVTGDAVTLATLKEQKLIHKTVKHVKILNGKIDKKVTIQGIKVSAGAKKAIEKAGGEVQEQVSSTV